MNKRQNNESGMTLVELLAAIVILVIIVGLSIPILLNGIQTADTLQKEITLRDEADFLMAALIKEFYVTKESEIDKIEMPLAGSKDYYIIKKDGNNTGIIGGKLVVAGKVVNTTNKAVTLSPDSTIESIKDEEGRYVVKLILELNTKNKRTMKFENSITTINDEEED